MIIVHIVIYCLTYYFATVYFLDVCPFIIIFAEIGSYQFPAEI